MSKYIFYLIIFLSTEISRYYSRTSRTERLYDQGVRATRAIGRDGRIGALPFPASLWTRTRDLPVAPEESLRQWWRRTHPDGITPAATVEAARRALKNQEEK